MSKEQVKTIVVDMFRNKELVLREDEYNSGAEILLEYNGPEGTERLAVIDVRHLVIWVLDAI